MRTRVVLLSLACTLAMILLLMAATAPKSPPPPDEEPPSPAGDVNEPEEPPVLTLADIRTVTFDDVPPAYADCVSYAAHQGFVQGVGGGQFAPDGLVSRAALVTILHRMSGQEVPAYDGRFSDVDSGSWYAGAVAWAVENSIASGYSDGTFAPGLSVTREQLAVFLCRAAGGGTPQGDLSAYTDGSAVQSYAAAPVAWALEKGLLNALVADTIHPSFPITRGQLAQVLVAFTALTTEEPLAAELAGNLPPRAVESRSAAQHDALQASIDEIAAKYRASGVQVAVIEKGTVTDTFTYGWAVPNEVPMTDRHKIRVASITKVAVGMAAMHLWDQGTVDLDADISGYWGCRFQNPQYPDTPITLRALLSHTSSIRAFGDDVSYSHGMALSKLLSAEGYAKVKPGAISSWTYNNYGFGVLGMTLELAAGQHLDQVMEEGFWSLMGIDAAFEGGMVADQTKLVPLVSYGGSAVHTVEDQRRQHRPASPGGHGTGFAGSLTISAQDLAQMTALLANDGRYEGLPLLSERAVEQMETRLGLVSSLGFYQCYPLRSQDGLYGRSTLCYHTGGAYGVLSILSYDPVARDGVVAVTIGARATKDDRGIAAVCGEISQIVYQTIADTDQITDR